MTQQNKTMNFLIHDAHGKSRQLNRQQSTACMQEANSHLLILPLPLFQKIQIIYLNRPTWAKIFLCIFSPLILKLLTPNFQICQRTRPSIIRGVFAIEQRARFFSNFNQLHSDFKHESRFRKKCNSHFFFIEHTSFYFATHAFLLHFISKFLSRSASFTSFTNRAVATPKISPNRILQQFPHNSFFRAPFTMLFICFCEQSFNGFCRASAGYQGGAEHSQQNFGQHCRDYKCLGSQSFQSPRPRLPGNGQKATTSYKKNLTFFVSPNNSFVFELR